MRTSTVFYNLIWNNRRVNFKGEMQELKDASRDFWYTIDCINQLGRLETRLSNSYVVSDYDIHKTVKSCIFPSAVTVIAGNQFTDYRDRLFHRFCEDPENAKLLSPGDFREAFTLLLSVMKVTPKSEDFSTVSRSEEVLSGKTIDQVGVIRISNTEVNGEGKRVGNVWTASRIGAEFPIPVTIDFVRDIYAQVEIDDEYITEWLKVNVINQLNQR